MFLIAKIGISAALIVLISEIAKRQPAFAALVASLPLVSVLAMTWMYTERVGSERIAAHSQATFWYVLPSLPMFLVLPWLLQRGLAFPLAMALCIALTALLYLLTVRLAAQFGVVL
ncbi:MAG: hypothetical protein NVS9B10_11690 [Nevskia sp.]